MMAAPQQPNAFADSPNVLVLVCLPVGPINRAVCRHAIESATEGVTPSEDRAKPDAVVELRCAAAEADAMRLITSYRGRIPSMTGSTGLRAGGVVTHCTTSRLPLSVNRPDVTAASGRTRSRMSSEVRAAA